VPESLLELLELELLPESGDPLSLELLELPEPLDGVGVLVGVDEPVFTVPDELDVLLPAELPVADACVDPGSTATTMPAASTEAKDTPTVVAFRRRLPCSRSATARAIWRAAA
jgi:hypothetical protein